MKNPKISIIMAAYNSERYLSEAINSILKQSYKNFELIIIDDSSKDKSLEIIKKFMKKDKRIFLIDNKKNLGPAESRNKGLKKARGDYIGIMDSDDISFPNRLKIEKKFLDKNRECYLVGGGAIVIDEKSKIIGMLNHHNNYKDIKDYMILSNQFIHSTVLFRKKILDFVGYYKKDYVAAQDYDFLARVVLDFPCYNLKNYLIKYRLQNDQVTKKKLFISKWNSMKIKFFYFLDKDNKKFKDIFFLIASFLIFFTPRKITNFLSIKLKK